MKLRRVRASKIIYKLIKEYYDENVSPELLKLRAKMRELLSDDNKLNQIVQLVGEDVLPNDQRIVVKIPFLKL